jgi:hypothetical protein
MAKRSVAQRLFLSGTGLLLAGIGGVFSVLMWQSFQRARAMEQWPELPCAILESEVESRRDDPDWPEEMPQEYRFRVLYQYDWKGEPRVSDRLSLRGASWSSRREKAESLVAEYPRGSVATCRVNPDRPDQVVLEADSKAPGYSLWFPLLFVLGGLGIVVGAWRRSG